jgi:xylulokinase
MTPGLLGIDVGTGSTKAVIIDGSSRQLAVATSPHVVGRPQQGWVETDPEAWWVATCEAVRSAVAAAGVEVRSIGLSGQMHGAVLTGADGSALRPAVLWVDQRAEPQLARYRGLPAASWVTLGNPLVPGMTGPILCWLAENEANLYRQAAWAMQAKDWLRLRLTGKAGGEHSDASGTLLYDLAGRQWAGRVISQLGLRHELLASLGESTALAGELSPRAAQALGLDVGVPVGFGASDTAAGLVGTGMTGCGPLQLTVGTGAELMAVRQEPRPDDKRRYHVFASALPGQFYAMAAIQAAGLAFQWAWSALGCDWPAAYQALESSAPGANGVSFIPHLAGARTPSMRTRATASFVGLTLRHDRRDLIRSVFEGIAFSIREAAEVLPEFGEASEIRLAGGGSVAPTWRQLLADVLDRPLLIMEAAHASARGAALLGGLAAGLVHELPEAGCATEVIQPRDAGVGPLGDAYARWLNRQADLITIQG